MLVCIIISFDCFFLFLQFIIILVVSSITPNTGSTQGGTKLTITGNYFSNSIQYPLVVKVGGNVCTILNVNQTTVECETSAESITAHNQYQGLLNILLNK